MVDRLKTAALASLLHDVGKVNYRAGKEKKSHSLLGSDFLRPFCEGSEAGGAILRCVRYHHGRDLSGAHLAVDDLAYLVYEADNIAAGADRRDKADGKETFSFDPSICLENVFNVFEGTKKEEKSYFPLKELDAREEPNYPVRNPSLVATPGKYQTIVNDLKANFQRKAPQDMEPDELLRILEDTVSFVPSSTDRNQVADISLYDHVKMTAAIGTSLFRYLESQGIHNYKDYCFTHGKDHRREKNMLFISGDFSGIQKFIYRVPTKGAMRMLRGRSFYLQIVLENVVDEILCRLGLSRANLIYSGGGHFYMLADNSGETIQVLEEAFQKVNDKLLSLYGTSLYLAAGWVPVCAEDLMGENEGEDSMFRRVNRKVAEKKQVRYSPAQVRLMTSVDSPLNIMESGMKECGLCHHSLKESLLSDYMAERGDNEEKLQVCPQCNGMYYLGKMMIDRNPDRESTFFVVLNREEPDSILLPAPFHDQWLKAVTPSEGKEYMRDGVIERIYSKNDSTTSDVIATRLWVGDYAAREDGKILDFADLAERSGGEGETGICRLGILRADVDWLGAVFMAGLPKTYGTLSRYASMSRSLSMFFAGIISHICRKELPKGQQPFYLFHEKKGSRAVHIVYSGGDDIFIAGAWDDLLELSVDLRRAFRSYTNGQLSFSAGLGLFSPTYPVIRMASDTGEMEDGAKKKNDAVKDSLALFGRNELEDSLPVFRWKELEEGIRGDKLQFLLTHFRLAGLNDSANQQTLLPAGKSLLYRILGILKEPTFNLAHFAYAIARLDPESSRGKKCREEEKKCYSEVRYALFQWGRSSGEDRAELETALRLVIYGMRDK